MPKDDIVYLLKFAPQEAYIDNLMDGRLYMNAAGYYHGLPGEQGDPLEASLSYGMGIYANWRLPIYCMFTVRESDIVDNAVVITRRMIDEFRCAEGWIGIVRYDCFEQLLNLMIDSGNGISLHSPVSYGAPGPRVTAEALQGVPHNLIIKAPKYAYQREYRIIGSQPVDWRLKSDENNPGRKTEEYGHEELNLGSSLTDFSWKVPASSLAEVKDGLELKLPLTAQQADE